MDVYTALGVEPVINAAGSLTSYGGSLMPPEVTDAMAAASRAFVDMEELHVAAGKRIAQLVGVDAAHICACATAGIALMAAACMTGTDRERAGSVVPGRLPAGAGDGRYQVIVQRAHSNPFARALRLTGADIVEIAPDASALRQALHRPERVAAVFHTFAWFCAHDTLPLSEVVEIARAARVPVIVDAAAEVPPLDNLTRFLREGADLVTFSGGKSIRGPQASGLILGRADLVEACRLNDGPHMAIGRAMKVGKEEIVALVKAVELYVTKDHEAEMRVWEGRVQYVLGALQGIEGLRAWRQFPDGVGQQIPHAAITWDTEALGITPQEVATALGQGQPRVIVQLMTPQTYASAPARPELRVHPHTLQEGEKVLVARRLRDALGR